MIETSWTNRSTSRAVIAPTLATWKPRNAARSASRSPNTTDQLSPPRTPQGQRLEHRGLVVGAGTPDLVVVAAQGGVAGVGRLGDSTVTGQIRPAWASRDCFLIRQTGTDCDHAAPATGLP